ncbi:MAG: serine hydrolase [Gordonia sp. (in: high G+C Gram-positive bacteria)]|uniref:serine hydrolase n=1 Tax=Gordonia sp. (in: high G+C Gram-positive bacteria) TaxID=84139 RepID=UPI0039E30D83
MGDAFGDLAALIDEAPGEWGVVVGDADSGAELFAASPDTVLRSASAAKLVLLTAVARRIEARELAADELLRRDSAAPVADSGIWQHLSVDALPVEDVARLVGLASDNLATNVLLDRIGGVDALTLGDVALHDLVRDDRGPGAPPTLSSGSARGYAALVGALHRGEVGGPAVSARVLGWLRGGLDLSMVASAFGLDPLAHDGSDRGLSVVNKSGTDDGIRVDVGLAAGPSGTIAYACLANWSPNGADDPDRDAVLRVMRALGDAIRAQLND